MTEMTGPSNSEHDSPVLPARRPAAGERPAWILWIDGAGAFLVCPNERTTIGGPAIDVSADIPLLANLSRRHATIVRSGEGYMLEALAPATVAGRTVYDRVDLSHGSEIGLGPSVRMQFRLPSAMSGTACLEMLSDHRPQRGVDGMILMQDVCLIGPSDENHVRCRDWGDSVVIFRRDGRLWCKSRGELFINGRHVEGEGELTSGAIVSGVEFRFRLEGA